MKNKMIEKLIILAKAQVPALIGGATDYLILVNFSLSKEWGFKKIS